MGINEVLKSKIGQVFTLSTGELVKIVDGFTCYESDYLEVINLSDPSEKIHRISIYEERISKSPDFKHLF